MCEKNRTLTATHSKNTIKVKQSAPPSFDPKRKTRKDTKNSHQKHLRTDSSHTAAVKTPKLLSFREGFLTYRHRETSNSYSMGCLPVRGDNPRALASGLSYVQVDKHGITILYHLHQCRPCKSRGISCLSW